MLRNSTLAPSFEHATTDSMKPRWLRHIRPTLSPSPIPLAASPWASALVRSSISRKVSVPSSSISGDLVAVALGGGGVAAGGRRPEAHQRAYGAHHVVRAAGVQDPRRGERAGREQLRVDLFGDATDVGHWAHPYHADGRRIPAGTAPSSISLRISAARRGLRKTWRWPTEGFSASRPASSSASPTSCASAAVVAGEAAREVREVGVVAAPLAHAVEPLEDAAGDAPGGVGVLVRAHGARRRPPAPRAPPPRAPRPSAGPRAGRRAAPPPRRPAADGGRRSARAARAPSSRPAGRRDGAGAQPVESRRVVVEGERAELLELLGRHAAGQGEQQEALEVAGAHDEVAGAGRRAGLGEVDERGDDGGDQQPGALARRLGVGAEVRRGRRGGQHDAVAGGDRHLDRRAVARARLLELLGAVLQGGQQDGPQARGGRRGRRRRRPAARALREGRARRCGLRYRRGR